MDAFPLVGRVGAIPGEPADRLEWLKKEADALKPHLIVIDLMWDFLNATNQNDYLAVRNAVNTLQKTLKDAGYKGALVVTAHGRKATNPDDPADDICGSTGQRGSFSTIVMLAQNRNKGIYTIFSEQTNRDEVYGEIEQTVIIRNADGTLDLGSRVYELVKKEKQAKAEESMLRLLKYIADHPGCEITDIVNGLRMGKQSALDLIKESGIVRRTGEGVKGDSHKYFVDVMGDTAETAAQTWKAPICPAQTEASRFAASGGIERPI